MRSTALDLIEEGRTDSPLASEGRGSISDAVSDIGGRVARLFVGKDATEGV